jgi:hypothetical protein
VAEEAGSLVKVNPEPPCDDWVGAGAGSGDRVFIDTSPYAGSDCATTGNGDAKTADAETIAASCLVREPLLREVICLPV